MSKRIQEREDGYYFRVRGNATLGPYSSVQQAQAALDRYVSGCTGGASLGESWPRWLHLRHLMRRLGEQRPQTARANQHKT